MAATEYTYFVQAGDQGPIKIGRSRDPRGRLADLQTANPVKLRLLLVIPGGEFEPILHARLAHLAMEGEWFRPDQLLLDLVGYLVAEAESHLISIDRVVGLRKSLKSVRVPPPKISEIKYSFLTREERESLSRDGFFGRWQAVAPIANPECLIADGPWGEIGHHQPT